MGIKIECSGCNELLEASRIGKQRYCKSCQAKFSREYRYRYKMLNDEQKKKSNARSYANVYQKRGKIKEYPCGKCGEKAEKHHEDYDKPLRVEWLCRTCHVEHHKQRA